MSESGESNSQKSEGMYSYKSDNNNNNNINNINNNIDENNNHISDNKPPVFESEAMRRTLNEIKVDQNQNFRNINPSGKTFFPSGSLKERDYYTNGTIPLRSSQISVVIPPESPLHWCFILIYIILEVILITLIATLFRWDKRNHPEYSCIPYNESLLNYTNLTISDVNIFDSIYLETEKELTTYYDLFKDINIMAFVGFGMLHTLTKGNSWNSIAFNILSIVFSFQLNLFFDLIFENAFKESWKFGVLNFQTFIEAIFHSCCILVSFGGILGKVSHTQFLVLIISESILSSLNFKLCDEKLKIIDTGGSLYVHTFGAIFGFAVFIVLFRSKKKREKLRNYTKETITNNFSRMTCIVGILFMISYFPSFNSSLALSDDQRYRCVINTYYAIIGSIASSFIISGFLNNGKFNYEHVFFGSFSGGIIISGCCSVCLDHWAALLLGMICGILCVIFLEYLSRLFFQFGFEDIYNILIVHGIPGILGAFITPMFIGDLGRRVDYIDYHLVLLNDMVRDNHAQAGIQVGGIFITLAIAFVGGITVGFLTKIARCGKIFSYYDDNEFFSEGMNEVTINNNVTNLEDDNQPSFIK